MCSAEKLAELRVICPGAQLMEDGPLHLIYLLGLHIYTDGRDVVEDALLCLTEHQGYKTRLFLAKPLLAKQQNWTAHSIIGRQWHSWSWQGVPATHRPAEILAQHLRALR